MFYDIKLLKTPKLDKEPNFRPTRLTGGTFLFSALLIPPNLTHSKMLIALLQITEFTCMIDYKQPFYNSVK